ncbi:hypothetical protein LPJ61_004502 [Coemansia biformis]|uniref:Reverse transcriptase/retrotransposon-derived protein RNase H-like domain-containing protein n=1 Tax=Coemansia biformis TaxID=1286918 RepID=A0A9W7Y956_9FUNG|nr:hypothetical protein LPJ61_004502 [Coemansia biformis]
MGKVRLTKVDQDALHQPWAALQQALLNVRDLYVPPPSAPLVLRTDAAGTSVRAVLLAQCSEDLDDLAPVVYFSRTFSSQQGSKPSIWHEACTMYEAAKHFYPYLDGCTNFWLETDCAIVVSLHMHKTTNDSDMLAHFKLGLAELGMKKHMIMHHPGVDQQTADWLSRAKEHWHLSKVCSAAPEMGGLKEAKEMIGSDGIVYTVGALMVSTQSTMDSTDTAEEMAPSASDDGDWVDSGDGHGILLWTDGDDEDSWVPDNDKDVNGGNPQLPSHTEQYRAVQAALHDLLWLSDFTDCQAEDTEIQSWIVLCCQCERLEDLLMPKFRMVKMKCLHSAVLYELVGGHSTHDAVGTWVLVLTRQAACHYVKGVHHALAHLGNMCTLEFIMWHVWCLSLPTIVQSVCGSCHMCQVSTVQMLNHMPMVMSQLHCPCKHLYIDLFHIRHWGDEALDALITMDSMCRSPCFLMSDNSLQLVSVAFEQFLVSHGIWHIHTSPYHPQSDLAESAVKKFKTLLQHCWADNLA